MLKTVYLKIISDGMLIEVKTGIILQHQKLNKIRTQ